MRSSSDTSGAAFDASAEPGGTVTLQVTAQLSGGAVLQALLQQERDPIVFTQTYACKLDYSFFDWTSSETNATETHHLEVQWTRGVGGTNRETSLYMDYYTGQASSNQFVTIWPADNGYWPSLPGQQVRSYYIYGDPPYTETTTVDAPSVEWMEESASGGTWPTHAGLTGTESSGREVRLFTGGKAKRQSQGLFDLSAALTCESGHCGPQLAQDSNAVAAH